jgi:primosomal protein N' (replication factor Y)
MKECDLLFCGPGVERIFAELKTIYPDKKIEIFSSDTLKKNAFTNILLKKVEKKKIDILIGTQLISKGFHFPKLNCVVVVDGDFSSHGYDLRSAEKNVQLYHQLSGRAGREAKVSTIYFQTYTPDDEVLINISKNDPHAFLKKELFLRKEKKLPPFYRLISLIISGKDEQLIIKFATTIKSKLPKLNNVNILGPVLAPITKLRKKYRCRILIRCPKNLFIQKYLSLSLDKIKMTSGIKLEVDVDPVNFS